MNRMQVTKHNLILAFQGWFDGTWCYQMAEAIFETLAWTKQKQTNM